MRTGSFATSYGTIRFDEKGDVEDPMYAVQRWSKGEYTVLQESNGS